MIEDDIHVIQGLMPVEPIPNITLGQLFYNNLLTNCEDQPALVDALTDQSISYKQLLLKTCSLAESLRRAGYDENSRIAISSENCVEYFISIIAAFYIGATVIPLNHVYTESEVLHALNISEPHIIFCSKQTYPLFLRLMKKILVIDDASHVASTEIFISKCLNTDQPLARFSSFDLNIKDHAAFILYSSGTTGLPKGVIITQYNVLSVFSHFTDSRLSPQEKRALLGFLPFFHAYGLLIGLGAIYKNNKIIVIKKFEEKLFLRSIEKYKIIGLPLVPPVAVLLAKSPLLDKYDLSSIQSVSCGAASLSKEVENLLKKRLKIDQFRQGYGLTESTLGVIGSPMDYHKDGSVGKLYPHNLCKIRDPTSGKSLGPKKVGEICIKGPSVMKGYYGNVEATRNTFTQDGWLLTGDLGYYDEEEYFYIVGRLKELIKYKGFQVAPVELEAILLTHPKIKDAAVIGLADELAGELPLAFVVKKQSDLTEAEVQTFVAERVSTHKKLRGGVKFVLDIPKNPSGKILRQKLHDLFKANYRAKL